MFQARYDDDLDPRRRARGVRRRDWASMSRTISVAGAHAGAHELLVRVLVRLGLVR